MTKTLRKPLKIWITARYDNSGIEEAEALTDPTGDVFDYRDANGSVFGTHYWFREGVTWHRTLDAAIKAAEGFRAKRIADAKAEIKLLSKPLMVYRRRLAA